jgi:hypothetical protein
MFLNWLVLVPILAAVLLVPVGAQRMLEARLGDTPQAIFLYAGFLFGILATGYVGFDLPSAGNARRGGGSYLLFGLLPLLLSACLLNTYWGWRTMTSPGAALPVQRFAWFGAAMHGGGMLAGLLVAMIRFRRPAPKTGIYATLAAAFTGAVAGSIAFVATRLVGPVDVNYLAEDTVRYTCIAFPLAMAIFLAAGTLLVGLTSYITEDKDREWWGRSGGMLLGAMLCWPAFASLILYATTILHSLAASGGAAVSAVTAGWATAGLAGSARTRSGRRNDGGISIDWISLQGSRRSPRGLRCRSSCPVDAAACAPEYPGYCVVRWLPGLQSPGRGRFVRPASAFGRSGDRAGVRLSHPGRGFIVLHQRQHLLAPRDVQAAAHSRLPRRVERQPPATSLHRIRRRRQHADVLVDRA